MVGIWKASKLLKTSLPLFNNRCRLSTEMKSHYDKYWKLVILNLVRSLDKDIMNFLHHPFWSRMPRKDLEYPVGEIYRNYLVSTTAKICHVRCPLTQCILT